MTDFDELLGDVLRADVCVEPPSGMERRIVVAVSAATKRHQAWMLPRAAIAAALLLVFVGMLASRLVRRAASTEPRAVFTMAKLAELRAAPTTLGVVTVPRKRGPVRSSRSAGSDRMSRREVARIAPLAIEALAMEPIGVAPLVPNELVERRTELGEQR